MASNRQRGRKQLLLTLAVLTAIPAQAQTAPAIIGGSDSQDSWTIPADDRDTRPYTGPVDTHEAAPQITIAANRDTIFGSLEDLRLTVKRDEPGNRLVVTVKLEQDREWLADRSHEVTIHAGDTIADLTIPRDDFKANVARSGELTATVDDISGYETANAKATVFVISQEAPVVTYSLSRESYTFAEDVGRARVQFVARMAPGMPRGVTVSVLIATRGKKSFREGLTATSGEDYEPVSGGLMMVAEKYELENGRWVGRTDLILPLFDDDVREGTETFELFLQPATGAVDVAQLVASDGTPCGVLCQYLIRISDEEDIPAMELSVSPGEIMEEGETSSTATLSITDHKSFATDQVLTFALAGTATKGDDYVVSPGDADQQAPGYQALLPVESTSVEVTFKAMGDEVDDPDEEIEVSPMLDGDKVGDMQSIRIMNQRMELPVITLVANRDTIIAGVEDLVLTATRDAPLDEALTVTVHLTQEQNWLSRNSVQLNFPADGATSTFTFHASAFSSAVTESGTIAAVMDSVAGYDTGDATVTVFVVSQEGPAMKVSFSHEVYQFYEDREDPFVILIAAAAIGMPRAASITFSVSSRRGTAQSPDDYEALSREITVPEEDFTFRGGLWRTQYRLPLTLIDDDVREGTETFNLILERASSTPIEVQLSDFLGAPCRNDCATPVEITDIEDIPELEMSLSADEIREEGETSSTATVSITNGKSFATDQAVNFRLGGDAIPGIDYRVTPADADEATVDHQVTLSAGSSSVDATFAARDDDREEGDEKIRLSVTHDGDAIGSGTIRIVDPFSGPKVEITFEGVRPPRDQYTAGIATGPFTTRITFSERVEGFTREDIEWSTHAGTTVDSTNIGVFMWDYTEVRAGLEYTARMMPEQSGRLWIEVSPGAATSVATGDGNQLGANSVWVELPEGRMMLAPTELSVDEGDAEGHGFMVVLTSKPTGPVTVTLSGTEGTALKTTSLASLTFKGPFWTLGRVVRVTAGDDANAADETVTLRLDASGGGYDGQSLNVVVKVKDDDSASGDVDDEAAALILLEGVTPEAAAAALLDDEGLSEARLDALDRLGNGNGDYDLGDLLSWIDRCRSGGASCGAASSPARGSIPGAAATAGLVAAGRRGRARHRNRRGSGGMRRLGRNRRTRGRPGRSWYGSALLLAATMWGCADDVVRPSVTEPDPGYLTVRLTTPVDARDMAAMLLVEGPGIDLVRARGFELFQSDRSSSTRRQIIISGPLATGPVAEFRVPDRSDHARYRVRLLQVAGEDYTTRDLSRYTAVVSRRHESRGTHNSYSNSFAPRSTETRSGMGRR